MASTEDGAVRVWDVPAATLLQTMRMSGDARVVAMSLSPTMDLLALATSDGQPTRLSLPLLVDLVPRDSESL